MCVRKRRKRRYLTFNQPAGSPGHRSVAILLSAPLPRFCSQSPGKAGPHGPRDVQHHGGPSYARRNRCLFFPSVPLLFLFCSFSVPPVLGISAHRRSRRGPGVNPRHLHVGSRRHIPLRRLCPLFCIPIWTPALPSSACFFIRLGFHHLSLSRIAVDFSFAPHLGFAPPRSFRTV